MSSPADTIVLFNAQTTSANSSVKTFTYSTHKACFKAFGTWGGATIALQVAAPTNVATNVWIPAKDRNGNLISFTADGLCFIEDFVYDEQIRAVLSGATGPTSLSCTLQPTG